MSIAVVPPEMTATFLVFSDDYGEHPSSCQHLFRYRPANSTVVWVNTIGMRSPSLSTRDMRKGLIKIKKMIAGIRRSTSAGTEVSSPSRVHVIQPPMFPFARVSLVRHINALLVRHHVVSALRRVSVSSPDVSVVTAPNACDYVGCFGEKKIVYYCVDDFTEWPGLDHELVAGMEEELIRKADTFIVTSNGLRDKFRSRQIDSHLITHGVDIDFFRQQAPCDHVCLVSVPRPRVGYFGLIDERCDQQLVASLAKNFPNVSFVITGDVAVDVSILKAQQNIYFTGRLPYTELPQLAQRLDTLILPYKINKLTHAIQPLKLKEYLATGKPVLSSPIREACALSPIVTVASSLAEWREELRRNLDTPPPPELIFAREKFLADESWQGKASLFFRVISG